jgi:Dolichyl-phosphate-mannose-protein mannosyltransferase
MKPLWGIVIITVLWSISVLIISPFGEFPLNDDWAYAKSVWALYNTGALKMDTWPAMTLVSQIVWGALFCKIGGLSFLTLRISTLITALIGLFAFYNLARQLAKDKNMALFATILLGFNPLFLSLSFTFMTDVHFFSFSMLASLFLLKNIQTERWLYFWLGLLCSLMAVMIRQPGILFPVAYALCYIHNNRTFTKQNLFKISFPFLATLIALILHSIWLKSTQVAGSSVIGISKSFSLFERFLDWRHVLKTMSCICLYTGVFILPLCIFYWQKIKTAIHQHKFGLLWVLLPIVILLFLGWSSFPMKNWGSGSVVHNLGLGPKTLKDAWFGVNISPFLLEPIWIIGMRFLGLLGVCMFCMITLYPPKSAEDLAINPSAFGARLQTYWAKKLEELKNFFKKTPNNTDNTNPIHTGEAFVTQVRMYLCLVMLMYVGLLIINPAFFDRHLILVAAFTMLLVLPEKVEYNFFQKGLGIASFLCMAWYSVSATHDYLAWNRVRWIALNELTEVQKISPARIDGGFEFNGWYKPGETVQVKQRTLQTKSWWWVVDDEYLLTFGNVEGYEPTKAYAYFQMLTFSTDTVYVLKRK